VSRLPKGYTQTPTTVGQHLLKVRLDRQMTKTAVARHIGVSTTTIAMWEHGNGNPETTHMKGVICFLGYYPLPEPVTLSEQIRKYRHVHGLTLEGFGNLLDVSEATVWTWENERYTPAKAIVQKITDLINQKELS